VVRRHEIRIVIGRFRIDAIATRRLDADDDIAEAMDGEPESAIGKERIGFGLAPALGEAVLYAVRQRVMKIAVVGEGKGYPFTSPRGRGRRPQDGG